MRRHKAEILAEALRRADESLVTEIYTKGGCYQYHKALKAVFPSAVAWYDPVEGHVYTQVGGRFFDIRGEHRKGERWVLMDDHKPHFSERAERWRHGWRSE